MQKRNRPDKDGSHRREFDRNKKKILATQSICAICGQPVDKTLKFPDPMSPTVDHIIPIARGGHPSAIDNLQLAHFCCNRQKGDGTQKGQKADVQLNDKLVSNRLLPQSCDWLAYRSMGA